MTAKMMALDKYTIQNRMKGEYSIMESVKWNIENKNEAKDFLRRYLQKLPGMMTEAMRDNF